jgi:hypothetical protein
LFHAVGRKDGRTYRRTDMTNLIVAFRNSLNAHRKRSFFFAKSLVSEWPAVRKGFAALL